MDNEKYIKQVLTQSSEQLVKMGSKREVLEFISVLIDNIDTNKIRDYLFEKIVIAK